MSNTGIVYYTCLTHLPNIEQACRTQLNKARGNLELVSVSRNQGIDFGDYNIIIQGERSPLTMHLQVLAGLYQLESENVFLCESDVLYHPSHFDFTPQEKDIFYYNTNVWKIRYEDGLAVWTDDLQQVSGICANRNLLIEFFSKRLEQIQRDGFNRHYEPNSRYNCKVENWLSEYPNIDIRHKDTLTKSKWKPEDFRNPKYSSGWKTSYEVPGWKNTINLLREINI